MKIKSDDSLFNNLEALSMLKLKRNERNIIKKDIENILEYMKILDEIDVGEEEEMITPVERELNLRDDKVQISDAVSSIVKEFPDKKDNYIRIPTIYNNER